MREVTEKTLWKTFSLYIRARDATWQGYARCISCSTVRPWREMDCGHYISKGSDSALKYHEDNNSAQCDGCNRFKSGNLIEYRFRLVQKIGEERVKRLETLHQMKGYRKKLTPLEITVMNDEYKKKLAVLRRQKCL